MASIIAVRTTCLPCVQPSISQGGSAMDHFRIDALARALATPAARRRALSLLLASGSVTVTTACSSALGFGRCVDASECPEGRTCCRSEPRSCRIPKGDPSLSCVSNDDCCGIPCISGRCCLPEGSPCRGSYSRSGCCSGVCDSVTHHCL